MSAFTRLTRGRYVTRLRSQRYTQFEHLCALRPEDRILDVGAGEGSALERFNARNRIVALDLQPALPSQPNVTAVEGDARNLPYPDGSFEICFSNSVLQYMIGEDRLRYASEVRRIAERYYVQAPYKYFPIEPHYLVPFFQLLPRRVQRWMNDRLSLGWRRKGSWTETLMPSVREMRRLFPDAEIHRERVLGLTKSLVAVRARDAA